MKYQQGKIKREHHTLPEFDKILEKIAAIKKIQRIIPGRIRRSQKGTGGQRLTYSYNTIAGAKYIMKKGGTAQELFITYDQADDTSIKVSFEQLGISH